jgi:hypothetical protein
MDKLWLIVQISLYIVPLVLIGLWLSKSNLTQRTKTLLLIALPLLYVAHYVSTNALTGWPSTSNMQEDFILISHHIDEPDKQKDDVGRIYLWINQDDNLVPRSFELAYDKELHKKLVDTQSIRTDGQQVQGRQTATSSSSTNKSTGNATLSFSEKKKKAPPAKASSDR